MEIQRLCWALNTLVWALYRHNNLRFTAFYFVICIDIPGSSKERNEYVSLWIERYDRLYYLPPFYFYYVLSMSLHSIGRPTIV